MPRTTAALTLALAGIAALATAGTALAGPPGKWTQVTGIGTEDSNIMRVGLARTPNGVLHVIWTRDPTGGGSVLRSTVSPDAKTVSGPTTVFAADQGVGERADIVVVPGGGLRAFFTFTNLFDNGVATSTSSDGAAWTAPTTASEVGGKSKPVYASGDIGAAVGLDGTFYSIWGDSSPDAAGYHVGLAPNVPDGDLPNTELESDPSLAVDSKTGRVVAAWQEVGGRTAVMPLAPLGGQTRIPGSVGQSLHPAGITGRIGAPGVFATYLRGTNPFLADPSLYRVDTGKATRLTKRDGEKVGIAAAPQGRLWVFWKDDDGSLRATRSNPAATRFGRIVSIKGPGKSPTVYALAGEASRGPLDLLAHAEPPSGSLASYHQRVLPGFELKAGKGKGGKTVMKAIDAGAPVPGVQIKVKGVKATKTTGAAGTTSFTLSAGKHQVTAKKKNYAPYKKLVRVK